MKKRQFKRITLILTIMSCLFFCQAEKVILEKESLYNNIRVIDEGRFLSLYCGNGHQSIMDKVHPDRLVFNYTKTMMAAFAFKKELPSDILLIGEGGGSLPKTIQKHFPDIKLDIVEIDPEVDKVAQKYFLFKPSKNTKVFTIDGRMFVKKSAKKYDIVMLDAFRGGYIPYHLLTKEFFTEVREILKPGGFVISNTFNSSKIRDMETNTYFSVFKNIYELIATGSGNRILFADNNKPLAKNVLIRRAKELDQKYQFKGISLENIINNQYKLLPYENSDDILTDDHSPAELLAD